MGGSALVSAFTPESIHSLGSLDSIVPNVSCCMAVEHSFRISPPFQFVLAVVSPCQVCLCSIQSMLDSEAVILARNKIAELHDLYITL